MKKFSRIFADGLLKSFIILVFLLGAAVLSYQAVMHFFNIPDIGEVQPLPDEVEEDITRASIDAVSKNLIFSVDTESGEINKLLLEVFHLKNKKMYYITIPVKTQFTMSDTLYRELIPVSPSVPQVIKFSSITKYFPGDTVYDYGVLLLEELLGIKFSYYTVVPSDIYDKVFVSEKEQAAALPEDDKNLAGEYPREVLRKDYMSFVSTLTTEEELAGYIEELYQSVVSNLTLDEKLNYLEGYCNIPKGNIYFALIEGKDANSSYTVDKTNAAEQLKRYFTDD